MQFSWCKDLITQGSSSTTKWAEEYDRHTDNGELKDLRHNNDNPGT